MNKMKVEVCSYTVQSALNAEKGGAYRVELCSNFSEGGTTPSYGMIELARKYLFIKLNVLIRPRGGDFCYSDLEFETMLRDIYSARQTGADGIAVGVLTDMGEIDRTKMKDIISHAGKISVTFHRAFDCVKDPFESLDCLIDLGAERVLTSGLKSSAIEGKELLSRLVEKSARKIIIMPGGGINKANIEELVKITKAEEYHLSGKSIVGSKTKYRNNDIKFNSASSIQEYDYIESDERKINDVVSLLNKI
jgi:copper homeostasis protein